MSTTSPHSDFPFEQHCAFSPPTSKATFLGWSLFRSVVTLLLRINLLRQFKFLLWPRSWSTTLGRAFGLGLIEAYPTARVFLINRNIDSWHHFRLRTIQWYIDAKIPYFLSSLMGFGHYIVLPYPLNRLSSSHQDGRTLYL